MSEKLQKVLARQGLGSRRGLEKLISEGRVSVNGKAAALGDRIEDGVTVAIDGKVVLRPGQSKPLCRVLMYHKPEGELTTLSDPEDRPTVFDHLPDPGSARWIYIGRLDINTSGLLLFTTDGELANALMHPSHGIERVYAARVYGQIGEEQINKLLEGVDLDDGPAHFDKVEFAGGEGRNSWYTCTLKEGRKREVRRLWEAVGATVSRLIRIKYAGIELDRSLRAGEFRELSRGEINILRNLAGMKALDPDEVAPALPKAQDKGGKGENPRPARRNAPFHAGTSDDDGSRVFKPHRGTGYRQHEERSGFSGRRADGGKRRGSADRGGEVTRRSYGERSEGGRYASGDRRSSRSYVKRDGFVAHRSAFNDRREDERGDRRDSERRSYRDHDAAPRRPRGAAENRKPRGRFFGRGGR